MMRQYLTEEEDGPDQQSKKVLLNFLSPMVMSPFINRNIAVTNGLILSVVSPPHDK